MDIPKLIRIDSRNKTPLYLQICNQIAENIQNGTIPVGTALPPTRTFSESLGVNRQTIISAYRKLTAGGLIKAHVGRGTIVARQDFASPKTPYLQHLDWSELTRKYRGIFSDPTLGFINSICSREKFISFVNGICAPECFPKQDFMEIISGLIAEKGRSVHQRSSSEGQHLLREWLAHWMSLEGKRTDTDEIMILTGSQQGVYLIAKMLCNPGDVVIVENPGYLGALRVFREIGAKYYGIPVDEDGMRVDILESCISRLNPKCIYLVPTFHNPTGTVLNLERREQLLDLAYRHNVPIIEDDPYSTLYFGDPPPPSLRSLDKHNHVLYLGTFSKMLSPGLRIGWVAAPQKVIRCLTNMRQAIDLHSNTLIQLTVHEFCKRGLMESHLKRIRSVHAAKRDAMIASLEKHGTSLVDWNAPAGGLYIWCRLNRGVHGVELLREAAKRNVAFIPGEAFYSGEMTGEWMRLNFSFEDKDSIEKGIALLMEAFIRQAEIVAKQKAGKKVESAPLT